MTSLLADVPGLIGAYGYGIGALIIALEGMGVPLSGEATLVAACVYAGATHDLDPALIILAAITGAVLGDNAGFWIGDKLGYRMLVRHGS